MTKETTQFVKNSPDFREAFWFWFRLGFISFGGPAGQIALMQRELVDRRKWIGQEDFLHALNFCMILPGPEAQQLATYIGWRLHGVKGGIVSGSLFVMPSVILLLALSYVYAAFGHMSHIDAILDGFKAVVVAIVAEALVKIGGRALLNIRHGVFAAVAFIAIYLFSIPFPIIVFAAALFGVLLLRDRPVIENDADSQTPVNVRWQRSTLKTISAFTALWLIPFLAAGAAYGFDNIATRVYLFFSQAAFVTFGGAYAVLAYVNQAVVGAGWITAQQSVDGLALAETTPGPLIIVLQFVGFMTGWNNSGGQNQTFFAIVCALLTTFATFLPSFLFIFVGAPHIERLRHNRRLRAALAGVTAAVVGVILNLGIVFATTTFGWFEQINFSAIAAAIAAFCALYFFRVDVLIVILAGGLFGLAMHFFLA